MLNKYKHINLSSLTTKQVISKKLIQDIIDDNATDILSNDVASVFYIWANVFNINNIVDLSTKILQTNIMDHIFDDDFIDYVITENDKRLLMRFYCTYEIKESDVPIDILRKYKKICFFINNSHMYNFDIDKIQQSKVSLKLYLKTVAKHVI